MNSAIALGERKIGSKPDYFRLRANITIPRWKAHTIEQLYYNTVSKVVRDISSYSSTIDISFAPHLADLFDSRRIYSDGKTGSIVEEAYPQFKEFMTDILINNGMSPVHKANKKQVDDLLEYAVQQLFEREGLPVAEYKCIDNKLFIAPLKVNLENFIKDYQRHFSYSATSEEGSEEKAGEALNQAFVDIGLDLGKLLSNFDCTVDDTLSRPENKLIANTLERRRKERLNSGTNGEDYSQFEYELKFIKAVPYIKNETLEKLSFVFDELRTADEKYGCWSADLKPENIFYDKNENPLVTDFNRVKRISMQEADAMIIDGYVPITNEWGTQIIITNPWDESARQSIVNERIVAYEKKTGKKIDSGDYKKYSNSARFYNAVNRMGYAIGAIANDENFEHIYRRANEIVHYKTLAIMALQELGKQNYGDYRYYNEEIRDLHDAAITSLTKACPQAVIEASAQWKVTDDFRPYITKYQQELNLQKRN